MDNKQVEKILTEELTRLQNIFQIGHELSVKYLPDEIRYSQHGKLLSGEVQNNTILIYEREKDKAIKTLRHEFIEWMINPLLTKCFDVINAQNKIIYQLLSDRKEDVVERLIKSL